MKEAYVQNYNSEIFTQNFSQFDSFVLQASANMYTRIKIKIVKITAQHNITNVELWFESAQIALIVWDTQFHQVRDLAAMTRSSLPCIQTFIVSI